MNFFSTEILFPLSKWYSSPFLTVLFIHDVCHVNLVQWPQLPRCLLVHCKSIWTSYQNGSAIFGEYSKFFFPASFLFCNHYQVTLSSIIIPKGVNRSWSMHLRRSLMIYWPNSPLKFRPESKIRAKIFLLHATSRNTGPKMDESAMAVWSF